MNSGKINECPSSASVWPNKIENSFKTGTSAHFNDRKKISTLLCFEKEINVFDCIFEYRKVSSLV